MQIASTMNASRISVGMKKMTGPERQKRSVQIDVVRACAILLVVGAHLRFQMPGGIMGSIAWAWHEWVRWILVYPPGGVRCAPASLWVGSESRLSTPVTVEMNLRKLSLSTKSKNAGWLVQSLLRLPA